MQSRKTTTSTWFVPQRPKQVGSPDDPEEESTQSDEETSEKLWNTSQQFGKLHDAEG